eukprot:s1506_g10.t1
MCSSWRNGFQERADGKSQGIFEAVNDLKHSTSKPSNGKEQKFADNVFGRIAGHRYFEGATMAVILVNAVCIGIDADYSATNDRPAKLHEGPAFFIVTEVFFAVFFTTELVVRFLAFKRKCLCFCDFWFLFDFLLVAMMDVETFILPLIASEGGPLGILSTLRLLRLLRVSRMAKLMRTFPELMLIVKGLAAAVRAVSWTLALLMMILFVWSIIFTSIYHQGTKTDEEVADGIGSLFGNMSKSAFSLIIMGTLLDDVTYCCNMIRESGQIFMLAVFIVFIVISSFMMLNMLLGILVEALEFPQFLHSVVIQAFEFAGSKHELARTPVEGPIQTDPWSSNYVFIMLGQVAHGSAVKLALRLIESLSFLHSVVTQARKFAGVKHELARSRQLRGLELASALQTEEPPTSHSRRAFLGRNPRLAKQILAHLAQGRPEHPLSLADQEELLRITCATLNLDSETASHRADGQPFRLGPLQALAELTNDPDNSLPALLSEGVHTGVFSDIKPSGLWPKAKLQPLSQSGLEVCQGNWKPAEEDPDTVRTLLQAEEDQGWIQPLQGGLQEAKRLWPKGIAVWKLSLVKAEGRDPRLVLDSTICQVNPLCRIPEAVSMPTVQDVRMAFMPEDPRGASLASISRQLINGFKVHRSEQGLLLFMFEGILWRYIVCHFGAKFSACLCGPHT